MTGSDLDWEEAFDAAVTHDTARELDAWSHLNPPMRRDPVQVISDAITGLGILTVAFFMALWVIR